MPTIRQTNNELYHISHLWTECTRHPAHTNPYMTPSPVETQKSSSYLHLQDYIAIASDHCINIDTISYLLYLTRSSLAKTLKRVFGEVLL